MKSTCGFIRCDGLGDSQRGEEYRMRIATD